MNVGTIVAPVTGVDQPKTHARSIGAWTLGWAKEFPTDFDSTFLLPLAVLANKTQLLPISMFKAAAIQHLCWNNSKMTFIFFERQLWSTLCWDSLNLVNLTGQSQMSPKFGCENRTIEIDWGTNEIDRGTSEVA